MKFSSAVVVLALPVVAEGAGFSYDPSNEFGPDNWPAVTDKDNQCAGQENSPLAINDRGCDLYKNYVMRTGSCTKDQMTFTVNDHGVVAAFPSDGSCERPNFQMPHQDGVYEALQFHIHTGSEHTVNGITFGAEMHIVHQKQGNCTDKRCFAVVGTKLNPASNFNNALFESLLEGWIDVHNAQETACNSTFGDVIEFPAEGRVDDKYLIDPYIFNRGDRFLTYPGGLTTPPCTEMVHWNLDDEPLAISPEQYTNLVRIILGYKVNCELKTVAYHGGTSRPTQPFFGRTVEKICPAKAAPVEGYVPPSDEPEVVPKTDDTMMPTATPLAAGETAAPVVAPTKAPLAAGETAAPVVAPTSAPVVAPPAPSAAAEVSAVFALLLGPIWAIGTMLFC